MEIWFVLGKKKIGTLAPPLNSVHRFDNNGHPIYLPPWMSDWLNLNVMVPMIAMIVIIVGILVICIALTRRRVDMRNGQKDVYCRFKWILSTTFNNKKNLISNLKLNSISTSKRFRFFFSQLHTFETNEKLSTYIWHRVS